MQWSLRWRREFRTMVASAVGAHDAVIVAATYIATMMFVWNGQIAVTHVADRRPTWFTFVIVAVGVAPLVVRRSRPVGAFVASTIGVAVLALVDAPLGLPIASGVALYSVAALRRPTVPPARVGLVVGSGFAAYVVSCAISIDAAPWSELLHTALLWSACWLAGERARLRREQLEELRRDALRERTLATAEERMRIAGPARRRRPCDQCHRRPCRRSAAAAQRGPRSIPRRAVDDRGPGPAHGGRDRRHGRRVALRRRSP